jgi:hypothetical protein
MINTQTITWAIAGKIWWGIVWRALLLSSLMVIGLCIIGFLIACITGDYGLGVALKSRRIEEIIYIAIPVPFAVIAIQIWSVKRSMERNFIRPGSSADTIIVQNLNN